MHIPTALSFPSEREQHLRTIASTSATMIALGIAYVLVFGEIHPHTFLNGIVIGLILGLGTSLAEIFLFARYRQNLSFSVMITLRTIYYVVLVTATVYYVILVHASWMHNTSLSGAFQHPEFQDFLKRGELLRIVIYALVASFFINFVRQVNKLLGRNALLMYITGKYHQPVEEERIFMFLDLKASTGIAEKLGDIAYHHFLNDFFHDVSPAIVASKGNIYQYVGDEVVVTWTKEQGLRDANCINCYFRIAAAIHLRSEHYERDYGFVPTFKAGFHFGPVVSGEIGDIKREIVYHGDTVNTAARIRTECTTLKKDLLLSGELLRRLSVDHLSPEIIGKIRLRGKEEEVELFSFLEAA